MIEVGILGIDTSHSEAFADQLSAREDAAVTAVWDGGDVRDAEYAERFCEAHDAVFYGDPASVGEVVDAAMVLTANWDTHRELAVPLLRVGIPTFVDKPIAGRLEDIQAIAKAAEGTPLSGGSAVPFHPTVVELPSNVPDRAFYGAGYGDPFYYGAHLVDTSRRLAGTDWTNVSAQVAPGMTVGVTFENGTHATLRLDGPEVDASFGFLDVADRTQTVQIGSGKDELARMYEPLVEAFLAAAHGELDHTQQVADAASLLLAVHVAIDTDGAVEPGDPRLTDVHVDGAAFLADYEPYY